VSPALAPYGIGQVRAAVNGGAYLVWNGAMAVPAQGGGENNVLYPATGIGVSKDGTHAIMVVFDGREGQVPIPSGSRRSPRAGHGAGPRTRADQRTSSRIDAVDDQPGLEHQRVRDHRIVVWISIFLDISSPRWRVLPGYVMRPIPGRPGSAQNRSSPSRRTVREGAYGTTHPDGGRNHGHFR
jgi:hypothetical protein